MTGHGTGAGAELSGSLRMYASSWAEMSLLSSGRRYSASHATIHNAPSAPVPMNAIRQPKRIVSHGTISGAVIAPILLPELKRPVASARSFLGNHSAIDLIEAGKLPDSPTPRQ